MASAKRRESGGVLMAPPPKGIRPSPSGGGAGSGGGGGGGGGGMFGLLGEAMALSSRAAGPPVRRPQQSLASPTHPTGAIVERLPLDLGLKKECVVTSGTPLQWCDQAGPARQAEAIEAAADGAAARASPAVHVHRALTHWRHPPQRLPQSLVKHLSMPPLGPERGAEASHMSSLRNDWAAALHSLFFALREGRCPLFYCRCDSYTLMWRNSAAPLAPAAGADAAATDAGKGPCRSCYAVLAPSNRGLRSELKTHGVPFEMPREGQTQDLELGVSAGEMVSIEPELAQVNSAAHNEEQTAARERHLAQAVDNRQASALLFQGHASLSALFDFLLNAKGPLHLTMQLLAPVPFLHGAARAAMLICTPSSAEESAPATHTLRVDAGESCGGPLLPGTLAQLCQVLQETQHGDFDLRCSSVEGRHSEWLNVPAPAAPAAERAQRTQPLARLPVHEAARQANRELRPASPGSCRQHDQPCTLCHIRCEAGVMRVLKD